MVNIALRNIEVLFKEIDNTLPKGNGPFKAAVLKHLEPLFDQEKIVKELLIKIKKKQEIAKGLRAIRDNLDAILHAIRTIGSGNLENQLIKIKQRFDLIENLNQNHDYDSITHSSEYIKLHNKLIVLEQDSKFIENLNSILSKPLYLGSNLLESLANAQKALLTTPRSKKAKEEIASHRDRIERLLNEAAPSNHPQNIIAKGLLNAIVNSTTKEEVNSSLNKARSDLTTIVNSFKAAIQVEKENLSELFSLFDRAVHAKYNSFITDESKKCFNSALDSSQMLQPNIEKLDDLFTKINSLGSWRINLNPKNLSILGTVRRAATMWIGYHHTIPVLGELANKVMSSSISAYIPVSVVTHIPIIGSMLSSYLGSWTPYAAALATEGIYKYIAVPSLTKLMSKSAGSFTKPIVHANAKSAYRIMVNPNVYPGLIHGYILELLKSNGLSDFSRKEPGSWSWRRFTNNLSSIANR